MYRKGKKIFWCSFLCFINISFANALVEQCTDYTTEQSTGYHIKSSQVYYNDNLLPNADVTSFEILKHPKNIEDAQYNASIYHYAKDKDHLYYDGQPIKGVSFGHFGIKNLGHGYLRDEKNIIYKGRILNSPKPNTETFKVLLRYQENIFYAQDKNAIYLGNQPIEGADPQTFYIPNDAEGYARDKNHIYYQGKMIAQIPHPNRFKISDQYLITDDHVFYQGKLMAQADPNTFEPSELFYAIDAKYIYYKGRLLHSINPDEVTRIGAYMTDYNAVFYEDKVLEKVNPAHFIPLAGYYGKDLDHAFYQGNLIKEAEAKTFAPLITNHLYAADKNHLYYQGKPIVKATAPKDYKVFDEKAINAVNTTLDMHFYGTKPPRKKSTYEAIYKPFESSSYLSDLQHIFYKDHIIDQADVKTFNPNPINTYYSADKHHVFYQGQLVEQANPNTYQLEKGWGEYMIDKFHAYYQGKLIIGSDIKTFKIINHHYAKDTEHVYYDGVIIEQANPINFKMLNNLYAKDDHHIFYKGIKLTADVNTFIPLNYFYAKDKQHVYYKNTLIDGASPSTFGLTEEDRWKGDAKDQHHYYKAGLKVSNEMQR